MSRRTVAWMSAAIGRALGRTLPPGTDGKVGPVAGQVKFGELGRAIASATVGCAYQGYYNPGVPTPEGGLYTPCDSRREAGGASSVPMICDDCSKEFWDESPL
jgi:hypothetical protein